MAQSRLGGVLGKEVLLGPDSRHSARSRNPACGNMCSRCYKTESAKAQANQARPEAAPPSPKPATTIVAVEEPVASPPAVELAAAAPAVEAPAPIPPPDTGRCYTCAKRVGLLGFACKCSFTFCSGHRYADAHACTFDYKAAAATHLTKANPLVAASKITKVRTAVHAAEARVAHWR